MTGFAGVTGLTVTLILYATGSFHMIGEPSTWVQEDSSGNIVSTFNEYDRTDRFVYVRNSDTGGQLVFDTTDKKIFFYATNPANSLYYMTDAFAITGYGLTYATYTDRTNREGKIIQQWDEKEWQWTQPGEKNPVIMTEYSRDQGSVYLTDGKEKTAERKLQIDYDNKQVILRGYDYIGKYDLDDVKGYRYRS